MGIREYPIAPRSKHITVGIENDHRVRAPIKDVDVIFRVHGDSGGFFVSPILR